MRFLFILLFCLSFPKISVAEIGVTDTEIKIGTVNAQSGPAEPLGHEINDGARALFKRINTEGGIHGRKIKWILEDDAYEPKNTVTAVHKLIDTEKVFSFFNFFIISQIIGNSW